MAGTPIKRARKEAEAQAREAAGTASGLAIAPAPPVARAREASAGTHELPELPPDPELAELAKRVLLDIAVNGGGPDAGARVGAARALVERAEEAGAQLVELLGSPERALEWMKGIAPRLEALVATRARRAEEFGGRLPKPEDDRQW